MASSVADYNARVVVAGLNTEKKSCVVSDDFTKTRATPDVCTVNDLWQVQTVPVPIDAPNTLTDQVQLDPPAGGLTVRMGVFPPDAEWQGQVDFSEVLAGIDAPDAHVEGADIGFHQTDTVDVAVVISGELYAVLEADEVCLKAGDTFVQRGTKHAWSNRSDKPAVVVYTMIAGTR